MIFGARFGGWVLFAMAVTGCSQAHVIVGRVVDEAGAPVAGAEVDTTPESDSRKTNRDGHFAIEGTPNADGTLGPLAGGRYTIRARKLPDYLDVEVPVVVDGKTTVELRLPVRRADMGDPTTPEPIEDKPKESDALGTPNDGI